MSWERNGHVAGAALVRHSRAIGKLADLMDDRKYVLPAGWDDV